MLKTTLTTFQYPISPFISWATYQDKITELVSHAVKQDSKILLFAEYAGLDLVSTVGDLKTQVDHLQTYLENYLHLFQELAFENQVYIIPGTILVKVDDNDFRNRAHIFSPNKEINFQDKMILTPAEREVQFIKPGRDLKVFDTHYGKIAIAVCYDSEFPELVRQQVVAGAQLILVPTCTESFSGFTRVHISARARAIENQCYVAQSCLINNSATCDFIETNVGQSGVYCPADLGFPDNGILAATAFNESGSVTVELDYSKLEWARTNGQVRNDKDHPTPFSVISINLM